VIEIDQFWNELLVKMAQTEMMSYKELKSLDIREFFITLVNWEKQNEAINERLKNGRN
jgi:hypothetical protein